MNWILAAVIVAVLFVGGCALFVGAASKGAKDVIDFSIAVQCYSQGWDDANTGTQGTPPIDGSDCERLYSDGVADRQAGTFDPPRD